MHGVVPPPSANVFNEPKDKLNVLSSSVEIRFDVLILDTERLDMATIDPNIVETFNVEPLSVLTFIVLVVILSPTIVEKAI